MSFFKFIVVFEIIQKIVFGVAEATYNEEDFPEIKRLCDFHDCLEDPSFSLLSAACRLETKVIENIRFGNGYGPEDKGYLCHYQVKKYKGQQFPQDATSALVQLFFPSIVYQDLGFTLPGQTKDFFLGMPAAELLNLLALYSSCTPTSLNLENKFKFSQWFSQRLPLSFSKNKNSKVWVAPFKKDIGKMWYPNEDPHEDIWNAKNKENTWKKVQPLLVESFAKLFSQALMEKQNYPSKLIESLIVSFIWKRENADLRMPVKKLKFIFKDYLLALKTMKLLKQHYSPNDSDIEAIDRNCFNAYFFPKYFYEKNVFDVYASAPGLLFELVLYRQVITNPYPPILGTGTSYLDVAGRKLLYSDCGESAIGALLRLMLTFGIEKYFDIERITDTFPSADLEMIEYFDKTHRNFDAVLGDKDSRSSFGRLLSGLNTKRQDFYPIQYIDAEKQYQISGGLDNVLAIFAKVLGDKTLQPPHFQCDKKNNEERAKIFTRLLEVRRSIVWSYEGQKLILPNYGRILLEESMGGKFLFVFSKCHFEFKCLQIYKPKDDWRTGAFAFEDLMKSSLDENTKSILAYFLSAEVH